MVIRKEQLESKVAEVDKRFPVNSFIKWQSSDDFLDEWNFGKVTDPAYYNNEYLVCLYVQKLDINGEYVPWHVAIVVDNMHNIIEHTSYEDYVDYCIRLSKERIESSKDAIKQEHKNISKEYQYIRKMKKLIKEHHHD